MSVRPRNAHRIKKMIGMSAAMVVGFLFIAVVFTMGLEGSIQAPLVDHYSANVVSATL